MSRSQELAEAASNRQVGTTLWSENDGVRIWELTLAPSQRGAFHCHATDYFWVCMEPGQVTQTVGTTEPDIFDSAVGAVDIVNVPCSAPLIDDLAIVGTTRLQFVTVEFNRP